jgi:integrase
VETLPSGSLRVRVYAGVDPVSKKRNYLVETVPAGPTAAREAEKVRVRFLAQVDERRNPRTKATVDGLLDKYFGVLAVEERTGIGYEQYARLHIRPLLGSMQVARLGGEELDSFFAALRSCRLHCRGERGLTDHQVKGGESRHAVRTLTRPPGGHECSTKCRPHVCRPLADSTIRQIGAILGGALSRAVKWRWISVNPMDQAEERRAPKPSPHPPTPEQAAAIATTAWTDLDWGMLVWLAMVTGARRGELCALAWDRFDAVTGVLVIRTSIAQVGARTWEKDTKAHQQRRIALDAQTVVLLASYLAFCRARAEAVGVELAANARIFSADPDGSTWIKPDSVGQRYERMCARLGWDMGIHDLRHFSATELIAAGVDVRTVAGRLGHGGGGTTTLKVYSAWVAEVDQRAAGTLVGRLPALPAGLDIGQGRAPDAQPRPAAFPYQHIADDLRAALRCGALVQGQPLPSMDVLAERYGVAPSTAHRAVAVLVDAGLVTTGGGHRAVVV